MTSQVLTSSSNCFQDFHHFFTTTTTETIYDPHEFGLYDEVSTVEDLFDWFTQFYTTKLKKDNTSTMHRRQHPITHPIIHNFSPATRSTNSMMMKMSVIDIDDQVIPKRTTSSDDNDNPPHNHHDEIRRTVEESCLKRASSDSKDTNIPPRNEDNISQVHTRRRTPIPNDFDVAFGVFDDESKFQSSNILLTTNTGFDSKSPFCVTTSPLNTRPSTLVVDSQNLRKSPSEFISLAMSNTISHDKPLTIEKILAMMKKESTYYSFPNKYLCTFENTPLSPSNCTSSCNIQSKIGMLAISTLAKARSDICHWVFNIIDHFKFSRETAEICMNLIDRYICIHNHYQVIENPSSIALIASAALIIAMKVNEVKKIKMTTLTDISKGLFDIDDLLDMEFTMLSSLGWLVHPPTTKYFCHLFIDLLPTTAGFTPAMHNLIFELTQYCVELSIFDLRVLNYKPSIVSFAALLNVLDDYIPSKAFSRSDREKFLDESFTNFKISSYSSDVLQARSYLRSLVDASDILNESYTLRTDNPATDEKADKEEEPHLLKGEMSYSSEEEESDEESSICR